VRRVTNHYPRDAELHDSAGAHETGLQRRIHLCGVPVTKAPGITQRGHPAMDDGVALLYEGVVTLAEDAAGVQTPFHILF
jgi:hypothetical protein